MKLIITRVIRKLYRKFFIGKSFYKINEFLFELAISGMGILNYENSEISGEWYFLNNYLGKIASPVVVFDVGGHSGGYAKMCIESNSQAEVYSFEPHPNTYLQLSDAASKFNFKAFNVGAGSSESEMTIFDHGESDGTQHASLYRDVIEKIHNNSNISMHKVKIVKLDNFIKEKNVSKIHLLKVDTEGHELEVLKGCVESIARNIIDVIHFEFNEMNVIGRVFFRDFCEILPNYDFYRLLPNGPILIKYNPLRTELFAFQNIIAVRKELGVTF